MHNNVSEPLDRACARHVLAERKLRIRAHIPPGKSNGAARWQLELSARPILRPARDTCSRHSIPGRPVIGDLSRKNINQFRCFAQNFSARKVFCAAGSCASTR